MTLGSIRERLGDPRHSRSDLVAADGKLTKLPPANTIAI